MARKKTFEQAMRELETIVSEMESDALSLEDAVKKYEAGIKQSEYCAGLLDQMEQKISLLARTSDGELSETKFETS